MKSISSFRGYFKPVCWFSNGETCTRAWLVKIIRLLPFSFVSFTLEIVSPGLCGCVMCRRLSRLSLRQQPQQQQQQQQEPPKWLREEEIDGSEVKEKRKISNLHYYYYCRHYFPSRVTAEEKEKAPPTWWPGPSLRLNWHHGHAIYR